MKLSSRQAQADGRKTPHDDDRRKHNREGTHDLQKECAAATAFNSQKRGKAEDYYHRDYKDEAIPDHGCYENLSRVLAPYGIDPEDVPNPFNLNQHMKIDGATGRMDHTTVRPKPGSYVDLRAEMDLLGAFSACPDMPVGGKPVDLLIYEP